MTNQLITQWLLIDYSVMSFIHTTGTTSSPGSSRFPTWREALAISWGNCQRFYDLITLLIVLLIITRFLLARQNIRTEMPRKWKRSSLESKYFLKDDHIFNVWLIHAFLAIYLTENWPGFEKDASRRSSVARKLNMARVCWPEWM